MFLIFFKKWIITNSVDIDRENIERIEYAMPQLEEEFPQETFNKGDMEDNYDFLSYVLSWNILLLTKNPFF